MKTHRHSIVRHVARRRAQPAVYLAIVALHLGAPSPIAAQASFSLDDVLSYSFASGLVAAPAGDRIAWIENDEGERNIWVAEGPQWRGRQLTTYQGDDGQELADLTFGPNGRTLLYVRGGATNRQGEVPDPVYTPAAEERALWAVDASGGDPRLIREGGGFVLHPDGDRIAYSQGRDLMVLSLDEGAEAERVARIRGGAGGLTWSPDGRRLAFVSNRGDHGFVGVLHLADERIVYLDPSVHSDGSPVWSPDGRQVAFLRQPNERDILPFMPRREGLPFSIRVADAESGEGREVWRADPGVGSVFSGIGASNQLFWAEGDVLVFPWEGDGWKHLYSVPARGGTARLLTPGAFEVQFAALAPDGQSIVYDSGQDDIDRKHVWRVPVSGGAPRLLTPGSGIEWGAVVTSSGAVAFHASSSREPAHTEVLMAGARRRVSPPLDADFPAAALVEPQAVVFRAADGMPIHAQLFLPPGLPSGARAPAVAFFHGGSRRQMLLGFHHRGYYHGAYAFNQYLASQGYVVLSVNYRSGIGYGMEFREALNYGATGASEFNDVLGAGLYLQSRGDVDADRIGLWGGSYGGFLTAMGLARASDLFKAGVDLHGVHDWNVVINNFVPDYEPEDHPDFSRLAYASSPMAFLDGWRSPVLIIHGDDDRNVPFSESVDLAESLARRGVPFEQLIFPDEVHGFLLHRNWRAAFSAAADFFDRTLTVR